MSNKRPLRVLHIIDTLGGGGSERLIWDIVRLSDQAQIKHRVVTIFPDGFYGPFVYANPLRQLGAYGANAKLTPLSEADEKPLSPTDLRPRSGLLGRLINVLRGLPPGLKRPLVSVINAVPRCWQQIRRVAASYFPSALTISREFLRFRPDIVHVHGFYSFKYGVLAKVLFRRPMVHTVPCLFSQMEAQQTGWLADYYRKFHPRVDCFALDAGYHDELLGVGVPAEKLFDISGTLDLQTLTSVRADRTRHRVEIRARLGIPEDAIIALSVGRLDPTKGHHHAVEALPAMIGRCSNMHWVLLGEGATRPQLEALIKELDVEHYAHLVGFDRKPLPYYAAADVYLRTTTMEGENISSMQAIAMGLPVVGFDNRPENDLIGKLGHGIIVPTGNADALAAATCRIVSMSDRGQSLGARGVDYCNSALGIQKFVDDLLSVYTALHQKGLPQREVEAGLVTDRERGATASEEGR